MHHYIGCYAVKRGKNDACMMLEWGARYVFELNEAGISGFTMMQW
jgi:hypothetical protein